MTENSVIIQVKGNQPNLLKTVKKLAEGMPSEPVHETFEHIARSRMETRKITVFEPSPDLLATPWDQHIKSVIQVYRHTQTFQTKSNTWKQTEETAYYLANFKLDANHFGLAIRGHWGIENCVNYVKDVAFREDESRIRRKPGIFARLRSFALNILRKNGVKNVSLTLYENSLNLDKVIQYQGV